MGRLPFLPLVILSLLPGVLRLGLPAGPGALAQPRVCLLGLSQNCKSSGHNTEELKPGE